MEKLPEHCPGPPAGQLDTGSETTSDTNLGKQLRRKEEELQQLRNEVESYSGKLKTFQTLGALYAESQRQCSAYKAQNDDLVRQLTGLMRRMSPTSPPPPPARENETETETVGKGGGDDAEEKSHRQSSWLVEFSEEGREKDASLSSSSVVNINSSSSDDSLRHGHRDNGVTAGAVAGSTQEVGAAVNAEDSASLSADISELTARLMEAHRQRGRDEPSNSSSSSSRVAAAAALAGDGNEHVSSDLIVSSLAVLKLEKQTRVQKAMMEQMSLKLNELDSQLAVRNQTIAQLQDDRARLTAAVNALRLAHDTRLTGRETEQETGGQTDTLAGSSDQHQQSGDWVQVEKRVSSAGRVDIAAVSTTEMELKRRVDKLSSMISELVTVNRSWDEHCKQQEISHSRQVAALNDELADVRRRLDDRQKCDDERQKEFDELMLSAKKQREEEEAAKEDALSQLHAEKRHRADAEERCVEFSRKMAELEAQLRALQTVAQSSSVSSLTPDRDMMLELQMLRDQVSVFKEDFDQERRDREASRTTIEHLDTKLRETNVELTTTKTKLMDALANLRSAKSENLQLKDRFQKVADDLKTLQRQAATRPAPEQYVPGPPTYVPSTPTYVPAVSAYIPTVSPTPVYTGQTQLSHAGRVWSCPTCTYENPAQRTSCEMCGRLKVTEQGVYRRDEHHRHYHQPHAAGLHDYEGAVPVTHSDWLLRLPSSNLETDQSAHEQL